MVGRKDNKYVKKLAGWLDGQEQCLEKQMDGWMDRKKQKDGWMDIKMAGWIEKQMAGWIYEKQMVGWKEE